MLALRMRFRSMWPLDVRDKTRASVVLEVAEGEKEKRPAEKFIAPDLGVLGEVLGPDRWTSSGIALEPEAEMLVKQRQLLRHEAYTTVRNNIRLHFLPA